MDFPDDETEFGRSWSSTAGELAGIKTAINEAEKRAGEAFIRRQDNIANALRDLSVELGRQRDKLSEKVQAYITESSKRAYERRKVLGH